jgi:hypothetical protein
MTKTTVNYHVGTYGVKGEAYVPTPYLPVYASATYNHTDVDGKNGFLVMTTVTVMH